MLPLDVHIEGQHLEILPEWREKIAAELTRLQDHYAGPIPHARVEIIGTAHHHLGAFEVHLVVNVPGEVITVNRQGGVVLPLLVEAFAVLDRRLEEHSHVIQQKTKAHEKSARRGRIIRLFPERDYGFIQADDGQEVYFHANALKKGNFTGLNLGMEVNFGQEEGDQGPQATWVQAL